MPAAISINTANSQTINGSGIIVSETRSVPTFYGIVSKGSFNIHITQEPAQRLEIKADDNLISKITTEVKDGILEIGMERGSYRNMKADIYISVAELQKVQLKGSGNITSQNTINADKLDLLIAGSGDIKFN